MSKKLLIAPLAALLVAGAAHASPLQTRLPQQPKTDDQLAADVVGVETHRSPGAIILQDALYGGLAGLAIGAGVALLNSDHDWGRDLAIGAGAGLLVGGIFGAVDAAANADRAPVGFGRSLPVMRGNF